MTPGSQPGPGAFTPEQLTAARGARNQASDHTPQAILSAIFPAEFRAANLAFLPLNLGTYMALEKVGSPLTKDGQVQLTAADMATALILFSVPAEQARRLVADSAALDEAVWALASQIPLGELPAIGQKLAEHLKAGFSTIIATGPAKTAKENALEEAARKKGGGVPLPESPAEPETASDGVSP